MKYNTIHSACAISAFALSDKYLQVSWKARPSRDGTRAGLIAASLLALRLFSLISVDIFGRAPPDDKIDVRTAAETNVGILHPGCPGAAIHCQAASWQISARRNGNWYNFMVVPRQDRSRNAILCRPASRRSRKSVGEHSGCRSTSDQLNSRSGGALRLCFSS